MTGKKRPAPDGNRAQAQTGCAVSSTSDQPQYNAYGSQKQSANPTPVYAGGRVIGRVVGDTFHKTVKASLHFLQRPRAIALDLDSLDQAERAGARRVVIHDSETGREYAATIAHIRARGLSVNRGYGAQIALLLVEWSNPADPQQPALFPEAA